MEVAQITVEDGTFQKCTVNKQLSLQKLKRIYLHVKLSKINFRGILSPKSVRRRTLVIGLIYGPRANKQFDIAL